MKPIATIITLLLLGFTISATAAMWPWRKRSNPNVETFHITAHKNTPIELWPKEPDSPPMVDALQFQDAFNALCNTTDTRISRYSSWVLEDAAQFQIDPFLLAALIYDQSGCVPISYKRYQRNELYSLTHFYPPMHLPSVRQDRYQYFVQTVSGFEERSLTLQTPLNRWKAAIPRDNIYLSAATMFIFKEQFPMLNGQFHSKPYRHYISNWIFGDSVRNPEPENRILTARRRLLAYYRRLVPSPVGAFEQHSIYSPLDGTPRLVIDYFNNKRGKKTGMGHRGIDIDGAIGEPVRAVASGQVVFAGLDMPGGGQHQSMSPAESAALDEKDIPQGGGLYVAINHGNHFGTIYMHLNSYAVVQYQEVADGEIIGTLGQSGSKQSGPHLHLEFRKGDQREDPAVYLAPVLVNPYKTKKNARSVQTALQEIDGLHTGNP